MARLKPGNVKGSRMAFLTARNEADNAVIAVEHGRCSEAVDILANAAEQLGRGRARMTSKKRQGNDLASARSHVASARKKIKAACLR